jgi:hypothetical protein
MCLCSGWAIIKTWFGISALIHWLPRKGASWALNLVSVGDVLRRPVHVEELNERHSTGEVSPDRQYVSASNLIEIAALGTS